MKNFLLTTAVCIASISGYAQGSYRQGFALYRPAPVTLIKRWVGALAAVSAVSFAGSRMYRGWKEMECARQRALEAQEALKRKQQDTLNLVADMRIVRIFEKHEAEQAKARHAQAESEMKATLARQESKQLQRSEQLEKEKQLLQEDLVRQSKAAADMRAKLEQALVTEQTRQLELQKEVVERRKEQDKVERIARVFADRRKAKLQQENQARLRENAQMMQEEHQAWQEATTAQYAKKEAEMRARFEQQALAMEQQRQQQIAEIQKKLDGMCGVFCE